MDDLNKQTENDQEDDKTPSETEEFRSDQPPGESPRDKNFHYIVSPISAGFIGLIGGLFLYQLVGGGLTVLILGLNVENASANSLRLTTAVGQILFILLPGLIFARLFYRDVWYIIRAKIPRIGEIGLFLLGIFILTPLLQSYLYIQNYYFDLWAANNSVINNVKVFFDSMNNYNQKTMVNLLSANNLLDGIIVVFVIALIPAISEEVMFRGFIQKSFELKIKPVWAALITAVFFGVYHFKPYAVIPLVGLGLYFGFAAYMSNSIVVPIILHFFNNFTAVIFYFMFGSEEFIKNDVKPTADIGYSIISFFVLLVIFSSVIFLIKKYYSQSLKV